MITIIEILFVMFLFSKRYIAASLWVMSIILFQMSFEYGNERIYLEIIEDYPIQDCVKPRKFKFLYKNLNRLSYKYIPKEMYYCETFKAYGFIIYSILTIVLIFIDEYIASLIGGIYVGFFCMLSLICSLALKKKSFTERYKILNKQNIRYVFLPNDEPSPRKIGNCQIIAETKKLKKTFVTVRMLETGEIKERVLLQGKKKQGDNSVYSIYEICKVFYIV